MGESSALKVAGFQQILKEVEFSHKPLRLHIARLERRGMWEG